MSRSSLEIKVLKALLNPQGWVSGEELASQLSLSRVAIWKEMEKLRSRGFPVASSRKGYRLLELPDVFFKEYLEAYFSKLPFPVSFFYRDQVDSTNEWAKREALQGAPSWSLFVAESQTRGKGRRGRGWFSLPGKSLTVSLLIRPALSLGPGLTSLPLVCGLAVSLALEEEGLKSGIKWPNDVLIEGKKVAGILVEGDFEAEILKYVVIGIGLNVNLSQEDFPQELRLTATSLLEVSGKKHHRLFLLEALLSKLYRCLKKWEKEESLASLCSELRKRLVTLGKKVKIATPGETLEGVAEDIDLDGSLWINLGGRKRKVSWGELDSP
ncbi:MAG: biotin--[acetyl-CoA-carboxylase] ligase [Candidatus Atribacteria bacterium]|nr:biotin--[acetyl-CoA-carboxylase] ligase [Candidatus Atribacteria bacterium]MCD6349687.1 biotin--[acetyl-CoA-carboxylase] ligase [Candidatus Atribacteria bacterium]